MYPPTHIIDPDGEVIIVLRNADSSFACPLENTSTHGASGGLQRTSTIFKYSPFRFETLNLSFSHFKENAIESEETGKREKKKWMKPRAAKTTLEASATQEPAVEAGEPAVETGELPFEVEDPAGFLALGYLRIQVSAKHLMFSSTFSKNY